MKLYELLANPNVGLCESKTKAKKLIEQGAVRINGKKESDPFKEIDTEKSSPDLYDVGSGHNRKLVKIDFSPSKQNNENKKAGEVTEEEVEITDYILQDKFYEEFNKLKSFYSKMYPFYIQNKIYSERVQNEIENTDEENKLTYEILIHNIENRISNLTIAWLYIKPDNDLIKNSPEYCKSLLEAQKELGIIKKELLKDAEELRNGLRYLTDFPEVLQPYMGNLKIIE